ncbi:hypothetical protein HDU93_007786 [Gonapodya sp. JEL0774]|nr:hypothetical protein HDU93_007786 [Gonapodya sp. JEL0774]
MDPRNRAYSPSATTASRTANAPAQKEVPLSLTPLPNQARTLLENESHSWQVNTLAHPRRYDYDNQAPGDLSSATPPPATPAPHPTAPPLFTTAGHGAGIKLVKTIETEADSTPLTEHPLLDDTGTKTEEGEVLRVELKVGHFAVAVFAFCHLVNVITWRMVYMHSSGKKVVKVHSYEESNTVADAANQRGAAPAS